MSTVPLLWAHETATSRALTSSCRQEVSHQTPQTGRERRSRDSREQRRHNCHHGFSRWRGERGEDETCGARHSELNNQDVIERKMSLQLLNIDISF